MSIHGERSKDYELFLRCYEPLRRSSVLYQLCLEEIETRLIGGSTDLQRLPALAKAILDGDQSKIDAEMSNLAPVGSMEWDAVESRLTKNSASRFTPNGRGSLRIIKKYFGISEWRESLDVGDLTQIPDELLYPNNKDLESVKCRRASDSDDECSSSSTNDIKEDLIEKCKISEVGDDAKSVSDLVDCVREVPKSDDSKILSYILLDDSGKLAKELEDDWNRVVYHMLKFGAFDSLSKVKENHPERFNKELLDLAAEICTVDNFRRVLEMTEHECDAGTISRAAKEGNVDVVLYLLAKSCPFDNRCMGSACHGGHARLVRKLVDKGLKANYVSISNAAMSGHTNLVRWLLERFWGDMRDYEREIMMENFACTYSTEAFVMASRLYKCVTPSIVDTIVQYQNAATLAYCFMKAPKTTPTFKGLCMAFERESAMVLLTLHRFHPVTESSFLIVRTIIAHGNLIGLVHYRLAVGPLDVEKCMTLCLREIREKPRTYVPNVVKCWKSLRSNRDFFGK